jgi:DNA-binding response OmpR family regulator
MKHLHSDLDKNILVVDDDSAILEAIQMIFELEGYSVLTAKNARSAFETVKYIKPQLILLDVMIAQDDGREIAKVFKLSPRTADIPIIMMSAHLDVEQSVFDSGADKFIPKPFEIDSLLSCAKRYVNKNENN